LYEDDKNELIIKKKGIACEIDGVATVLVKILVYWEI
jgi:hypothetical protein